VGPLGVMQLGERSIAVSRQTDNLFDMANDSSYDCSWCGLPVIIVFIWQEIELYADVASETCVGLLPPQTYATSREQRVPNVTRRYFQSL
jgi:hypothetical protein